MAIVALLLAPTAEAAIKLRNKGADTLGAPDIMAASREACESSANRVWVDVAGGSECIAYYPSGNPEEADRAVLYFEGDVGGEYRRDNERLKSHLATMRRLMEILARAHGVRYVFVARPGTFGSTGDHRARRNRHEYLTMNAAVDRIKVALGLRDLVLAGQSGGATVAAALMALGRTDIRCATPGSGGYDLAGMMAWHAERSGRESAARSGPGISTRQLNVLEAIDGIVADRRRRVFLVGDPEDKVTPFALQRRFAEVLRGAGHHAEMVESRGAGAERHGLTMTSLRMAGLCAAGRSDAEIRAAARRP